MCLPFTLDLVTLEVRDMGGGTGENLLRRESLLLGVVSCPSTGSWALLNPKRTGAGRQHSQKRKEVLREQEKEGLWVLSPTRQGPLKV